MLVSAAANASLYCWQCKSVLFTPVSLRKETGLGGGWRKRSGCEATDVDAADATGIGMNTELKII